MAIAVTRSSMPEFEEYIEEIRDLWTSHWLTNMGTKHKQLEARLLEYLKVPNLTLFVNGHLALEAALAAFQLKGEVITTPFTFASTTHAIVRNGLTPVFCDVNLDDYNVDVNQIEPLITEKTSAIVPVHVFGNACDVEAIQTLADKYHLKVIYDAAHAFGVTIGGIGIGNFGDVSMFSFHATKVFNTIEGGALAYKDVDMQGILKGIKNFGITGLESVEYIGGNAKMNEFQAAMGLCNLRHIDDEIEKRRIVSERYLSNLEGIRGIKLVKPRINAKTNYSYLPIVIDGFGKTRDEVYDNLRANNILARKYFYPLTNSYKCYADRFHPDGTPVAKEIADRILTLPLYADLSLEDVDIVCGIIKGKSHSNLAI
jgi:dTDP-4-amino-4,6-dideoxygalactose transaminase